jgi:HK97 gp10 family phage protein
MPGRFSFNIRGADDLARTLKELGPRLARKHGQKAVREGLKPVLAEARRLVPVDTGALKRSLRVRNKRSRRRDAVGAEVSATAPHAHLVEFGTVKMAPQPFLRVALDANRQEVLDRMAEQLARGIEQEVK